MTQKIKDAFSRVHVSIYRAKGALIKLKPSHDAYNIRNNKNHARTPKWAQRWGLVDTSEIKRKERKSQWAARYNDRLPHSALEGQPYEEGQEQGSSVELSVENRNGKPQRQPNGDLWRPEDESYYNSSERASVGSSSGRWHYPANFDDVEPSAPTSRSKKKKKKDRWERTQDAYSMPPEGESRKKKKKKRKSSDAANSVASRDSGNEFPEDPEGGLYSERPRSPATADEAAPKKTTDEDVFKHQF
ncbi:hypothetical protein NLJ89_g2134 [Agrocybe chaxingu]|uniref:Uncharacterized protein n=1 Tax=Agrocybe chaxingu TaxID=84603 RepID=A0A9W8KBG4_9AGAR|nr:hypothetical protein NLJ89_g2134 [Agrocybe chaxingu]